MKKYMLIHLMLLPALLLLAADSSVSDYIPQPDFASGWQWDFEPEMYTPENLYEYINGEAELYNSYTFREMVTASYVNSKDDMQTITVDIYDMGSPLDAFGIYSRFRRPGLDFADIGEEAIVSDYNTRFYVGKYFVQVNSGSRDDEIQNLVRSLSRQLAAELPATDRPVELALLPLQGQLPHTLTFHTSGFMGLEAFANALAAQYAVSGDSMTVFIILCDEKETAKKALAAFEESVSQRGEVLSTEPGIYGELPYQGKVMAGLCGDALIGATGFKKDDVARQMLRKTCDSTK